MPTQPTDDVRFIGSDKRFAKPAAWQQSYLSERMRSARKKWIPIHDLWDEYYAMWRSVLSESAFDFRSKLFIPMSNVVIEAMVPHIVGSMFGSGDWLRAEADQEAFYKHEEDIRELTRFQQIRKDAIEQTVELAAKQMTLYGTTILKTIWKRRSITKRKRVFRPDVQTGEMVSEIVEDDAEFSFNGPHTDVVDVYGFYPAPNAKDLKTASYVVHDYWLDGDQLMQIAESDESYNKKEILKLIASGGSGSGSQADADRLSVIEVGDASSIPDPGRGQFKISEYWEPGAHGVLAGIGPEDDQYLIRKMTRNPYHHDKYPFSMARTSDDMFQFWGISDLDSSKSLQYELNTLRMQRLDLRNLIMNPMFTVPHGSRLPDHLFSEPGALIPVERSGELQRIDWGDIPASNWQEEQIIKTDLQIATGAGDFFVGQPTPGFNDTATGITRITNQAIARFQLKPKRLARALENVCSLSWELNGQFLEPNTAFRILDGREEPFRQIPFEALAVNVDFVFKIDPNFGDQGSSIQNLLTLAQTAGNSPDFNVRNFLEEVAARIKTDRPMLKDRPPAVDPNAINDQQALQEAEDEFSTLITQGFMPAPALGQNHIAHEAIHQQQQRDPSVTADMREALTQHLFQTHLLSRIDNNTQAGGGQQSTPELQALQQLSGAQATTQSGLGANQNAAGQGQAGPGGLFSQAV